MFPSRLVTSVHQPPFPTKYTTKVRGLQALPVYARPPWKAGGFPIDLFNYFAPRSFKDLDANEFSRDDMWSTIIIIADYTLLDGCNAGGSTFFEAKFF